MSDYTPTTEEVRQCYIYAIAETEPREYTVTGPEFDRWLAAHDAEVYQRGREDAAKAVEAIHCPNQRGYIYPPGDGKTEGAIVCDSCWDGEYRFDIYPCETLLAARGDGA